MPPLISAGLKSSKPSSWTSRSLLAAIASIASSGRSANSSSASRTFSSSVIEPKSAPLWYITPILRRMRRRAAPWALVMSSPSMKMWPAAGA